MANYELLYLSCLLRYKSVLPLLNDKVKAVNICIKTNMDKKNCVSKVV